MRMKTKGFFCIGETSLSDIWIWTWLGWPEGFITERKDKNGKFFRSKSTTLEAVGMLLPFVAFPNKIRGKRIHFMIDNMAVMFGWMRGFVKEDETASEILKAVHYLSGKHAVTVNV